MEIDIFYAIPFQAGLGCHLSACIAAARCVVGVDYLLLFIALVMP